VNELFSNYMITVLPDDDTMSAVSHPTLTVEYVCRTQVFPAPLFCLWNSIFDCSWRSTACLVAVLIDFWWIHQLFFPLNKPDGCLFFVTSWLNLSFDFLVVVKWYANGHQSAFFFVKTINLIIRNEKKIKLSGEINNRNEKIKFSPRKSTSSSSSPINEINDWEK
jgi:hypothetical protein